MRTSCVRRASSDPDGSGGGSAGGPATTNDDPRGEGEGDEFVGDDGRDVGDELVADRCDVGDELVSDGAAMRGRPAGEPVRGRPVVGGGGGGVFGGPIAGGVW